MNSIENPHDSDLVGAYVLDALEPTERTSFEEHLRTCESCVAEVAELLPVVDVLALAADLAEPPEDLGDRIVAALTADPVPRPELQSLPGGQPRRERRPVVNRFQAGLSLVAAALIAALGLWNVQLRRQIDTQQTSVAYQQDVNRALLSGAVVSALPPTAGGSAAQATLVQPKNGGQAYLLVRNLPATPTNRVYELWYIRGKSPRPVTTFRYSGNAVTVVPLRTSSASYGVAAVTLERRMVQQPTTKPIVAGKLSA